MRQFFILVLFISTLSSCTQKFADSNFKKGHFDRSIALYKKGLKDTDGERNFKIAEAYRKSNRLKEAAQYYNQAQKAGHDESSLAYYFARSLKANEQYEQAEKVLTEYVTRPNADKRYKELAQRELDNLGQLESIKNTSNYYRIKNLTELNTPLTEYAPVIKDNQLFFTSNRNVTKIYNTTGTPFTDLYKVKTRGANVELRTLETLDGAINHNDTNEGSIAIGSDGSYIVFAKGNNGKASGNAEVNLYFTRFRNAKWLEPRPVAINDPDAWDSTPALSLDGNTLYFASTREGGYGGADLYSAQLNRRGRWVDVKNLGSEINTSGDEMFPFVSQDGRLYFSSDGHGGFGNLDLFVATRQRGRVSIENLGEPMNSASDDFSLYQYDLTRGFFSSNRPGGAGDDDIYTYVNDDPDLKIVNYFLEGVTMTKDNGGKDIILPNTKISLIATDGEVIAESFTGPDAKFKFRVYTEEQYSLLSEKTDYFSTRKSFSTVGKSTEKEDLKEFITNVNFQTNIMMERIVLEKSIVLNDIFYDLDKADIRTDAAIVLDSLVGLMNDNPDIYIELGSHTDARADDDYNLDLSIRRAKSAVQYMIRNGVGAERIVAKGYGETKLVIQNAKTEEEHQRNRRTEFKVLKYNPAQSEDSKPPTEDLDEYDRFFDE